MSHIQQEYSGSCDLVCVVVTFILVLWALYHIPVSQMSLTLLPFSQVPEIISSIRQAGKIARQEELRCPSEFDDTFAKKFEVLFCGRVTVAHKKAPPALIDECIEKFNHVSCGRRADWDAPTGQPSAPEPRPMRKSFSQPGLRSLAFRKEFQDASLRSSTFSSFDDSIENHLIGGHNVVQPTDMEENRTMLFTVKSWAVFCTLEV